MPADRSRTDRPLRILIGAETYPLDREKHVDELIKAMAALPARSTHPATSPG